MRLPGISEPQSKRIEVLLWIAGLGCALICCITVVQAAGARRSAAAIQSAPATQAHDAQATAAPGRSQDPEEVIGRMDIPGLALTVPILADDDPDSLRRGVGHIKGTAFPGGLGTVGLAGHRDTFLRPMRRVAPGMEIRLVDSRGAFIYEVDRTEVVMPEQVEVLDIRDRPELTVVTCFPFNFVGAAPKRFIVHAHLLSLLPQD